ncbi:MAG: AAA family ATPase [Candidatus Aphodocola sp.]
MNGECVIINKKHDFYFNLKRIMKMNGVKDMEILNVLVGGFRNISSAKLKLGKITAIVGLNGSGKSNLMDAIDFAIDFIHFPPTLKKELMNSKKCVPLLSSNAGMDFNFAIDIKLLSKEKQYFVKYGFSFSWGTEESNAKISSETLQIKKDESNQKYSFFIKRNGTEAFYKKSETGRCNKKIKIDDDTLVLNKILSLDDLYYYDIIEQLSNIQLFIERHLDPRDSYRPDPFIVKGFNELELNGIQSIPRAIFFLKRDYPGEYELLIDAFKQLFPEIIEVYVKEIKIDGISEANLSDKIPEEIPFIFTDSIYSLNVKQKNLVQPINFERLSDGTKRVFLMLTFAIISSIKGLSMFAIEEPENSLHPRLLQYYIDIINQLTDKSKILITSHSPYMIQYLDPHDIYIAVPNNDGESNFRNIAPSKVKNLVKDAYDYETSVGDYIFNILSSSNISEDLEYYIDKDE